MRKARIAAKINHTEPLRLQCLKLNGFVIDQLPFEEELSGLKLLTCGDKCFDAGLRAPKTRHAPLNRWSGAVNNAPSHCMIVWPNWQGIFDAAGHQRDESGEVVAEGVVVSTSHSRMGCRKLGFLHFQTSNLTSFNYTKIQIP
ncbi:predicted protein [Plenodomus lingam JN3]|uniref:Predicted protein n=1 Tax=Leptosphaeria maculans (strain JN3 / isolate v23.1.3 / race Av1-4-5-6-7-8) TaxID=985895 RepID=E4ZTA9_LEPMJ|nr:predicted protein [Plenodomus lingam JN3]CBX94765.1 predicted protein [Plenodomus lingam JN3]